MVLIKENNISNYVRVSGTVELAHVWEFGTNGNIPVFYKNVFSCRRHLDKLLEYCQTGVEQGATLVYGGKRVERPGEGASERGGGARRGGGREVG